MCWRRCAYLALNNATETDFTGHFFLLANVLTSTRMCFIAKYHTSGIGAKLSYSHISHQGMTNYRIGPHRIPPDHIEPHWTMSDHVCKRKIVMSKTKPKSAGISFRANKLSCRFLRAVSSLQVGSPQKQY